jgi:hypothetical protein
MYMTGQFYSSQYSKFACTVYMQIWLYNNLANSFSKSRKKMVKQNSLGQTGSLSTKIHT